MGRVRKRRPELTDQQRRQVEERAHLVTRAPEVFGAFSSTAAAVRTIGPEATSSVVADALTWAVQHYNHDKGTTLDTYVFMRAIWDLLKEAGSWGKVYTGHVRKGVEVPGLDLPGCDVLRLIADRERWTEPLDVDERDVFGKALDGLLPRDRSLIELVMEGMPVRAAGESLGMSRQTSFNAWKRSCRCLKAMLYHDTRGWHLYPRREDTPRHVAMDLLDTVFTSRLPVSWVTMLEGTTYTPQALRDGLSYSDWFGERLFGVWCYSRSKRAKSNRRYRRKKRATSQAQEEAAADTQPAETG